MDGLMMMIIIIIVAVMNNMKKVVQASKAALVAYCLEFISAEALPFNPMRFK